MEISRIDKIINLNLTTSNSWKEVFSNLNGLVQAKVEEVYKNFYGLEIAGKKIMIPSEVKLFKNETLNLKISSLDNKILLEIQSRFFSEIEESPFVNNNPRKSFAEIFKSISKEPIVDSKVFQVLNSYFPNIEWREDTRYFEWQFIDGDGKGFFGKKDNSEVFFLEMNSKLLGEMQIYLFYKKKDLSDLKISIYTKKISSYNILMGTKEDLLHNFETNGIELKGIQIYYLAEETSSEWIS